MKRFRLLTMAVLAVLILLSCAKEDLLPTPDVLTDEITLDTREIGPQTTTMADIVEMYGDQDVVGWSGVKRTPLGIRIGFHSQGNHPNYAYSLGLIVFNNPSKCGSVPCTMADLENPQALPDFLIMPGGVPIPNGNIKFPARVDAFDTSISALNMLEDILNTQFGQSVDFPDPVGITSPFDAEYHILLRSHGPIIPDQMEDQISSYDGGCTSFVDLIHQYLNPNMDPVPNAEGECGDIQVSVQLAD